MPNAYILNQIPVGYGAATALLAEMLVAGGWSYKGSGDGLAAFSATGKVFTGTGTGAGGWNNQRAWARLSAPDNRRELVIQIAGSAGGGARIKYSALATFTGGAPSATTAPSATDERIVCGAGTDASPTFGTFYNGGVATGVQKFYGMASAVAPYGFWFCGSSTPAAVIGTGLLLDPVDGAAEDPDPVVIHIGSNLAFSIGGLGPTNPAGANYVAHGGSAQGCWGHMDIPMAQFLYVAPTMWAIGNVTPTGAGTSGYQQIISSAGLPVNPFNGKHEALPVLYTRGSSISLAAPVGIKGWSRFMRWTSMARAHGQDTLDGMRWICIGQVWLPWDGATPPTS